MPKKKRAGRASKKTRAEIRAKAARKAARTRQRNRAAREREKEQIEQLLDEDFETLAEARRALQEQSEPKETEVNTAAEWDQIYDDFDYYIDDGEYNSGVTT